MVPEATPLTDDSALRIPFLRLDPSGRRLALWAWIDQAQGDPRLLWSSCPRGDWLAWWLSSFPAVRLALVRACCECLRMAEAGFPLCLDAPRRFLIAVVAWTEGLGELDPCLEASHECALLAADESLAASLRATARAVLWLARFLAPAAPEGPLAAPPEASEVCLTLWHAAAAIASEVNPTEPAGSPWWGRCLEAALGRFAEVLRGCVDFEDIELSRDQPSP
jgi:hypothetical protein